MPRIPRVGQALPPRLRWYVLAASAAGLPIVAVAAASAALSQPSDDTLLGTAMFFGFALLSELRPVPIDPAGKRDISLAFVFIISIQLLFGWDWSVLAGAFGIALAMTFSRNSGIKVIFNAATYAIAAGLAAAVGLVFSGLDRAHDYAGLVAVTIVCGAVFVLANVILVCIAIGLSTATSIRATFADHLRHSGPIFAIMVFVADQAVIFWRMSARLVLLLGAPLFALTLYQRSYVRRRIAEEEAATDSLTALKNRRAFERGGRRALAGPGLRGELSLCLIDIDHFKQVNDRHGHPSGDAMLGLLASVIDELAPGCGYRLGGDEFAFLLRTPAGVARETADRIREQFVARQAEIVPETVTISAGIAVFPENADELHALVKHARPRALPEQEQRPGPFDRVPQPRHRQR